jgi:hypothetical protein
MAGGNRLRGRWRLFRHEAGRTAGPAPWVYVLLFAASQLIGHWSVATFDAVAVWLSNGILAAALLQLHRRPAVAVLTACFTINLFSNIIRGDAGILLWLNALMNMGEAFLCAFLARRVCGDHRQRRLEGRGEGAGRRPGLHLHRAGDQRRRRGAGFRPRPCNHQVGVKAQGVRAQALCWSRPSDARRPADHACHCFGGGYLGPSRHRCATHAGNR